MATLGRAMNGLIEDIAARDRRIAELERQLAEAQWRPITTRDLPTFDHEIGRWHPNGFWQVESGYFCKDIEGYRDRHEGGGLTHFRPLNAPKTGGGK